MMKKLLVIFMLVICVQLVVAQGDGVIGESEENMLLDEVPTESVDIDSEQLVLDVAPVSDDSSLVQPIAQSPGSGQVVMISDTDLSKQIKTLQYFVIAELVLIVILFYLVLGRRLK